VAGLAIPLTQAAHGRSPRLTSASGDDTHAYSIDHDIATLKPPSMARGGCRLVSVCRVTQPSADDPSDRRAPSLSGTMAIATTLKDTLLPIDEQTRKASVRQEARGGRRRSRVECAVRRKGRARSHRQGCVVFGCWTSVSRSVLPCSGLTHLFLPVQSRRGSERNVFYPGAAPNSRRSSAVDT